MGRIGERREWKRIGRIEKSVIPILLIQLVGDNFVTNSYIRKMQINWFLWGEGLILVSEFVDDVLTDFLFGIS